MANSDIGPFDRLPGSPKRTWCDGEIGSRSPVRGVDGTDDEAGE
jgi:hypothetical protein